eukprot:SAG31_NODE_463_length_15332_cov_5.907700_8_plen_214_part_01
MDDWHRPKAVVIRATDDFDIERTAISDVPSHHLGVVHHRVLSRDPFYDSSERDKTCSLPSQLPVYVRINDNDEARVAVSQTSLQVTEGLMGVIYTVRLLARPTKTVYIDIEFDSEVVLVTPKTLSFEAAGWTPDTNVAVEIIAVNDDLEEEMQLLTVHHRVRTTDKYYGDPFRKSEIEPPGLLVSVVDDDYSGLLVIKDTLLVVREGGETEHR